MPAGLAQELTTDSSASRTFFVATPLEKFAGIATHQQQDVNKETSNFYLPIKQHLKRNVHHLMRDMLA